MVGSTLKGFAGVSVGKGQAVSSEGTLAFITFQAKEDNKTGSFVLSNVIVGDLSAKSVDVSLVNYTPSTIITVKSSVIPTPMVTVTPKPTVSTSVTPSIITVSPLSTPTEDIIEIPVSILESTPVESSPSIIKIEIPTISESDIIEFTGSGFIDVPLKKIGEDSSILIFILPVGIILGVLIISKVGVN